MANFVGDLSSGYNLGVSVYGNTTGITTDGAGASVDFSNQIMNVVSAILVIGARTGTGTPTLTAKIQESTDGSNNWTDCTGGGFTGSFGAQTVSNTVVVIPVQPTKRYLRSTATVAGTSPVFPATITIIGPYTTAPTGVGGFNNTAAAANG